MSNLLATITNILRWSHFFTLADVQLVPRAFLDARPSDLCKSFCSIHNRAMQFVKVRRIL
eukprot:6210071-Pleurochrysis_carterae.AAC.3